MFRNFQATHLPPWDQLNQENHGSSNVRLAVVRQLTQTLVNYEAQQDANLRQLRDSDQTIQDNHSIVRQNVENLKEELRKNNELSENILQSIFAKTDKDRKEAVDFIEKSNLPGKTKQLVKNYKQTIEDLVKKVNTALSLSQETQDSSETFKRQVQQQSHDSSRNLTLKVETQAIEMEDLHKQLQELQNQLNDLKEQMEQQQQQPIPQAPPNSPNTRTPGIFTATLTETVANWKTFPKFSGVSEIPFKEWINKVNDLLDIQGVASEESKKAHLRFCLQGSARAYLDTIEGDTYDEICKKLASHFVTKSHQAIARTQLQNLKQNDNETVGKYLDRCCEIIQRSEFNQDVAKNFMLHNFVNGLKPYIRTRVRLEEPTSAEKAAELALKFEAICGDENESPPRTRPKCTKCNKLGHTAKNCRSRSTSKPRRPLVAMVTFQPTGLIHYQFTGSGNISFTEWIKELEAIMNMSKTALTEEQKMNILRAHLSSMARIEFDGYKDTANAENAGERYTKMKTQLETKYPAAHAKSRALARIDSIKFNPKKGILAFAEAIRNTVTRAMDEGAPRTTRMLQEFVKGLPPKVKTHIRLKDPDSFEKAVNLANEYWHIIQEEKEASQEKEEKENDENFSEMKKELEQIRKLIINQQKPKPFNQKPTNRSNSSPPKNRNFNSNRRNEAIQPVNDNKRMQELNKRNQTNTPMKPCYKCQKHGHWAKDCPDNVTKSHEDNSFDEEVQSKLKSILANKSKTAHFEDEKITSNVVEVKPQEDYEEIGPKQRETAIRIWNDRPGLLSTIRHSILLCTLLAFLTFPAATANLADPILCNPSVKPQIWRIPTNNMCTKKAEFYTEEASKIKNMTANIYAKKPFPHYEEADHCKIVKTVTQFYTNLLNDQFVNKWSESIPVSTEECQQMRKTLSCQHGNLTNINGLWATNNSFIPEFKWSFLGLETETNFHYNCYLSKSIIYTTQNSNNHIETVSGAARNCRYTDKNCTLTDHSVLVWNKTQKETCELELVGSWPGWLRHKHWVAYDKEFALSFSNRDIERRCDEKYISTDQGYLVKYTEEVSDLLRKSFDSETVREKRDTNRTLQKDTNPAYVDSKQLAASLSNLSFKTTEQIRYIYNHLYAALCTTTQNSIKQLVILAETNPTQIARDLLGNDYCQAKYLGYNRLQVWQCMSISENRVKINPTNKVDECYEFIPVKVEFHNDWMNAFYDPKTRIISKTSKRTDCSKDRLLLAQYKNSVSWIDQVDGTITTTDTTHDFHPRDPMRSLNKKKDIHAEVYHNLILTTNIDRNLPILHWRAEQAEEEYVRLALDAIPIMFKNSSHAVATVVKEGWFSFLTGIHFDPWQIWVFICCAIVTLQITLPVAWALITRSAFFYLNAFLSPTVARSSRKIGVVDWNPSHQAFVGTLAADNPSITVEAEINGQQYKVILDTGANLSIVTKKFLDSLEEIETWDAGIHFIDPAGRSIGTTTAAKLNLKLGEIEKNIVVHAIDYSELGSSKADAIIGVADLQAFGPITFDFDLNRVRIGATWLQMLQSKPQKSRLKRCRKAFRNLTNFVLSRPWRPTRGAIFAVNPHFVQASQPQVLAMINGKPIPVLLDSGSAITLASLQAKRLLNVPEIEKCDFMIEGIGGEPLRIVGQALVDFKLGNNSIETTIFFADIPHLPAYDLVVGCDTMRKFQKVTFNLAECKVTVNSEEIIMGDPHSAFPTRTPILAMCTRILEPNSETLIDAVIGPMPYIGTFHYTNGSISEGLAAKHLDMTPGVFTPDQKGSIKVCLVNPTETRIPIYEGTVISTAHSVIKRGEGHYEMLDDFPKCNATKIKESDQFELNPDLVDETYKVSLDNSAISEDQKRELQKLLDEFSDVFSKSQYDLGSAKICAPTIVTTTQDPVRSKPRKTAFKYQKEIREHIDKLLKSGVIVPSDSPWMSALVIVEKKTGGLRPCIDFRKLNNLTISDHFPLPRIEAVLERIGGAHYYSSLDLSSGYMQIPLDEESSYKCGLTTTEGSYRFTHLPFGLKNASSAFCRVMTKVLEGLEESVLAYIDDVLIFTKEKDFQKHLDALRQVFLRMRQFNLKLQPKKCTLAHSSINFLGHEVGREGYTPLEDNIAKIKQFPTPTNLQEVRRFVGMASFFRRFIPEFSKLAEPLTRLNKKDNRFLWAEPQQKAFDTILEKLTSKPILTFPNYDLPFYVFTDASSVAQAGVLMQKDTDSKGFKLISCCSRSMTEQERRLPAVHAEVGAIVYSLRQFKGYIYGSKVIVYCDHRPLQYVLEREQIHPKLGRWVVELREYNIKIIHIDGSKNAVADALSRSIPETEANAKQLDELKDIIEFPVCLNARLASPSRLKEAQTGAHILPAVDKNTGKLRNINFKEEQRKDPFLSDILTIIEYGEIALDHKPQKELDKLTKAALRYQIHIDGCLITTEAGFPQLVVPEELKKEIFNFFHYSKVGGCHPNARKALHKARKFWWDGMNRDFTKWSKECLVCQQRRKPTPKFKSPMVPVRHTEIFTCVEIDLCGPFKRTERENIYILNAICTFSKFLVSVPITDARATTIARALLENLVLKYGAPRRLHSDNSSNFTSEFFNEFCGILGIEKSLSTPYHSQGNALVERSFQIMQNAIAKMVKDDQSDWDLLLPFIAFSYNTSIQDTTKETPFFLLHGFDPLFSIDLALDPNVSTEPQEEKDTAEFKADLITNLKYAYEKARHNAKIAAQEQKQTYDEEARTHSIQEGDRVLLKNFKTTRGLSPKLDMPWKGQFRVMETSDTHAIIKSIEKPKQKPKKVHIDQIKLCLTPSGPALTSNTDDPDVEMALIEAGAEPTESSDSESNEIPEPNLPLREKIQVTRYGRISRPPKRYQ